MNALVTAGSFGAPSTKFQGQPVENDLGAGIKMGYPKLGIKGKVFAIRRGGMDDLPLMRADNSGPMGSLEMIIVACSKVLTKTWYEKGFQEGNTEAPDCFSSNGVTPDPASKKKQCTVCNLCPKDAFGSGKMQDGSPSKGKACADAKRAVVVPLNDPKNEAFGGMMLLRIPADSLKDLAAYGAGVVKLGHQYYGVGTRLGFDPLSAHPKLTFSPIRPLTDQEADMVIEMRADPQMDAILATTEYVAAAEQPEPEGMKFEQPVTPSGNVVPIQTTVTAPAPTTATGFGNAPAPTTTPGAAPKATRAPRKASAATTAPAAVAPAPPAVSGFGAGGAPAQVVQPVAQQVVQATAAPAVVEENDEVDFDAALDAEVEGLMAPAA